MYRDQKRYGKDPTNIVRTATASFNAPLRWRDPVKVFTCSWSDFFISQADDWRDDAWGIIRATPHISYQILTKRPERIAECLPADWGDGWPHVWLGVSVENATYLKRAHTLAVIPARVRFISYEPALGPVDFSGVLQDFHWLISGGESGPAARMAPLAWFNDVRDQCARAGVAYFHKQHGGKVKTGGAWGGRMLQGKLHNDFPVITKDESSCAAYNFGTSGSLFG